MIRVLPHAILGISLLATGCLGTHGKQDSAQELRDFVADTVHASTQNVQNELWPWMVLLMSVYGVGKASSMIMYWLQNRRLKRSLDGEPNQTAPRSKS